ncbi:MAG: DUF4830 domain-containing protein [Oscillospiraceae bacterium]|nr:DUF4830 domain-containing protein [Oscillospiraceae bacterium]
MFILFLIAVLCVLLLSRCVSARHRNLPKAENPADIAAFLAGFGWEVSEEPVNIKNVQIPAKFNEVYSNYNAMQKKQGFDLSKYRADIAESWCFRVLNHPRSENTDVFANVLVFKGKIIGGDICSYAIDGFMTGFDGVTNNYS